MSRLTSSSAWLALAAHRRNLAGATLAQLFAADATRAGRFSLESGEILLDYFKNRIDAETMRFYERIGQEMARGVAKKKEEIVYYR